MLSISDRASVRVLLCIDPRDAWFTIFCRENNLHEPVRVSTLSCRVNIEQSTIAKHTALKCGLCNPSRHKLDAAVRAPKLTCFG